MNGHQQYHQSSAAVDMDGAGGPMQPAQKVLRNYKLLVDPFLVKGRTEKLYRYDGVVPSDPAYPPVLARDPRNQLARLRSRLEPLQLPVPRWVFAHVRHNRSDVLFVYICSYALCPPIQIQD